mmetsp:Transcript_37967/g.34002  ORF Transcript_37967/g.34002 Transcript_37967/m.34002 type:complete len:88 (+) Transcript_37967:847-1110(+)|eukprot:CAMPEP_0114591340 /NCGR_PEP_ID=MMETSP0125-20121206/13400_1 /TAXON_ID=485358 ORGANISM="Aristerostoma sp., Strain ATCC 50986" /NCGR_SAMPLE_ID=MMETSP0125 /ASSEMBLY_ACC=CAM_ASM_000245 /LENGTH=87 /DNA_ID=CAMNT_0001789353 /DNA_START=843 /DNA_END=1106 /DNA_ORIENTATION=+
MLKNRYYYLTKKGIVDRDRNQWVYGQGVYKVEGMPRDPNNKDSDSSGTDGNDAVSKKVKLSSDSSDSNVKDKSEDKEDSGRGSFDLT